MSLSDSTESPEITSIDQLEATFHDGASQPSDWKIGVEYEKPVVDKKTGEAVPYEGPGGIGALLAALKDNGKWEGLYEDDHLIALGDGRASITLEPGGQFELSGEICDSLHAAKEELDRHVAEILAVSDQLGIAYLGLGITPKTAIAAVPWMPKQRYRIMRDIMRKTGTLGHRMMQQTTTVQANFDYSDERDARDKFRIAMGMSPILVAMTANSPVVDGELTRFKSYRAHVWTDTDADRCGVLPFAFDTNAVFRAYTEYALDVPMYFLARGSRLLELGGRTFRDFMASGLDGEHATLEDWTTHLTTLFPEARMKTYIEVRAADSQSPELMLGTPALMKGLFYESDCLDAAWDIIGAWTLDQRLELLAQTSRHGLAADGPHHPVRDYAKELVEIAHEGLRRQAKTNPAGEDETIYLEPLAALVEAGMCPADKIIEAWNGPWHGKIAPLVAYASYTA
jgi:glutamate--cysteine ligase